MNHSIFCPTILLFSSKGSLFWKKEYCPQGYASLPPHQAMLCLLFKVFYEFHDWIKFWFREKYPVSTSRVFWDLTNSPKAVLDLIGLRYLEDSKCISVSKTPCVLNYFWVPRRWKKRYIKRYKNRGFLCKKKCEFFNIQGVFLACCVLNFSITPPIFNFLPFWKLLKKGNEIRYLMIYAD